MRRDFWHSCPQRLLVVALTVLALSSVGFAERGEQGPVSEKSTVSESLVEGLWSYTTIAPGGRNEAPLTGLFLFHQGRFIQQAINDGEPFDQQVGQGHAGTYQRGQKGFDLVAELAIAVMPSRKPPLSLRRDTEHQIFPELKGEELALTFGSGTVQKFKRVGDDEGEVITLDEGKLALLHEHFLLVATRDGRVVAGSGTYERRGDALSLKVLRWFSVEGEHVTYIRSGVVESTFDGHTLKLEDGTVFPVKAGHE